MLKFNFLFDNSYELEKNAFMYLAEQINFLELFDYKKSDFQIDIIINVSKNSVRIGFDTSRHNHNPDYILNYPVHWKTFKHAIENVVLDHTKRKLLNLGQYFILDYQKRQLLGNDLALELTEKECDLLAFLAENAPIAYQKEDLLKQVWSLNPELDTHTVETHIYRLRQKLSDHKLDEQLNIETTAKGYVLNIIPD